MSEETVRREVSGDWSPVVFLGAMLAAAVVIFLVGRGGFFHGDDWDMMVYRTDLSTGELLRPHVDHLVAVQVFVIEVLRSIAGWHYGAFRLVMIALHLTAAAGIFVFARRRLPGWLALALVLPFLVLGSGYPNLLWAGVLANSASIAAGVWALVVLEGVETSGGRRVLACALLSISLLSMSFGLAFAVAALVALLASSTTRRLSWIAAGPLVLYGIWRLAHPADKLSLDNLRETPEFVAECAAAAFGGLTGLGMDWGRLIAIVVVLTLGGALLAGGRRTAAEYAALGSPILIWAVTGLGRAAPDPTAQAIEPKYIYAGAATTLLALAVLLALVRLAPLATVAVVTLSATGLFVNLGDLGDVRGGNLAVSDSSRTYIGALEVARPAMDPAFNVDDLAADGDLRPTIGTFGAADFFKMVKKVGEEPVDIAILPRLPAERRAVVDSVLVRAERFGPATPPKGERPRRGSCGPVPQGPTDEIAVPPAGMTIRTKAAPADLFVRRFANAPAGTSLGTVNPNTSVKLVPARDRAPRRPWQLRIASGVPVDVCT